MLLWCYYQTYRVDWDFPSFPSDVVVGQKKTLGQVGCHMSLTFCSLEQSLILSLCLVTFTSLESSSQLFKKTFFFNVDHFLSLFSFCYNITSAFMSLFFFSPLVSFVVACPSIQDYLLSSRDSVQAILSWQEDQRVMFCPSQFIKETSFAYLSH